MAKLNKTEAEIRAQIEVHRRNGDIDKMTRLMKYLPNAGANKKEPTQTILDRMQRIGGKVMDGVRGANGAFDSAERFVKDIPNNIAEGAITATAGLADLTKGAMEGATYLSTGGRTNPPSFSDIRQGVNNLRQRASDTTGIDFTQKEPATPANRYVQTATEFMVPPVGGAFVKGGAMAVKAGANAALTNSVATKLSNIGVKVKGMDKLPASAKAAKAAFTHPFARGGSGAIDNILKNGIYPGIGYQATEDLTGNSALAMGAAMLAPSVAGFAKGSDNLVNLRATPEQSARNAAALKLGVPLTQGGKADSDLLRHFEGTALATKGQRQSAGANLLQHALSRNSQNIKIADGKIGEERVKGLLDFSVDKRKSALFDEAGNPKPAIIPANTKGDLNAIGKRYTDIVGRDLGKDAKLKDIPGVAKDYIRLLTGGTKAIAKERENLTADLLAKWYSRVNGMAWKADGDQAKYLHKVGQKIDEVLENTLGADDFKKYVDSRRAYSGYKIAVALQSGKAIDKDNLIDPDALHSVLNTHYGADKFATGKMDEMGVALKRVWEILRTDGSVASKRGLLQRFAQAGLYSVPFIISNGNVVGLVAIGAIATVAPDIAAKIAKTKPVQNFISNQGKIPSISPAISATLQQQDAGKPTHPFERKMK